MYKGSQKQMIRYLLIMLCCATPVSAQHLEHVSSIELQSNQENFGGLSGLHVFDGGETFLAISDAGRFLRGKLTRTNGKLSGGSLGQLINMIGVDGTRYSGLNADSEGLALDAAGNIYVSYESNHRVRKFEDVDKPALSIPKADAFKTLQRNSSLEALAAAPDGTLYTLPERSGDLERPFPVWRFANGKWREYAKIPRRGRFLTVGADIGPDGRFYLLERDFRGLLGFGTRVRSFEMTPKGLQDEKNLLQSGLGEHDNLEGISVWQDETGSLRVTMVSDDNFQFFQTTELVEYILVD